MNVPLNAFFYWAGGPLPWLRAQGIASFQRHHPGWSVFLGSPDLLEAPPGVVLLRDQATDPSLPPAARSDHWRYLALCEHGGLYADTDVVFVKSVEPLLEGDHDAWVTTDLGTPVPLTKLSISIGVLAARHGSKFFRRAADLAASAPAFRDYQCNGTKLLATGWAHLTSGLSIGALPARSFYRGWRDVQVARLWAPGELASHEFALHWYGGSPASARGAAARSLEELPRCLVRSALEA